MVLAPVGQDVQQRQVVAAVAGEVAAAPVAFEGEEEVVEARDLLRSHSELMPKLFAPEDLAMMGRLRDAFNPDNRCSPRKMLPTAGACIEQSKAGRHAAM